MNKDHGLCSSKIYLIECLFSETKDFDTFMFWYLNFYAAWWENGKTQWQRIIIGETLVEWIKISKNLNIKYIRYI